MPAYSYRRSFRLWRCLHMETMNIWTHLVGSVAFIVAGIALGGGASMNYYVFYCRPAIQRTYWVLNLASSVLAAITLFDTGGGGARMRTLCGSVFTLLAL